MKKFTALMLLAFMMFTFIACSDKTKTNDVSESDNKTDSDSENNENDYSILELGIYQITEASTGKFLASGKGDVSMGGGKSMILGDTEATFTVRFDEFLDKPFCHIFEGDDMKVALRTDSQTESGNIRLSTARDLAEDQTWQFRQNDDGTYTIMLYNDNNLCIAVKDGNVVLAKVSSSPEGAKWNIKKIKEGSSCFLQYISNEKNIIVRLPNETLKKRNVDEKLLQDWANNIQTSYNSFKELTSFTPYKTIVIKAYEECEVLAGVCDGDNNIYIRKSFIADDLDKMGVRRNRFKITDFNFCVLHEMGHMFDSKRGWNFESEMETDLKLTYVLEKNNVYAAPSEFSANQYFNYDNIEDAYMSLGGKVEQKGYSFYGGAYVMVKVQKQLGWEPYKKTFAWFQSLNESEYPKTKVEKFQTFIDKLSEYSGKDVKSMFTQRQWDAFIKYYSA